LFAHWKDDFDYTVLKMSTESKKDDNNDQLLTDSTSADKVAVSVKGLRKSFKNVTVLDGIDFDIRKGTVLALLGPNGAGKTTTVHILSTLLLPDSGIVKINNFDVVSQVNKVRSLIGLTGQYAALDEYLTARENLQMIGRLYRLSYKDIDHRTDELLELFDLVHASKRAVKTYSGGMRRRLDLAVSLIAFPPILFLDEPTTGLDPQSRLIMWDIIKHLVSSGTTVLLTTQNMDEADHLANKIIVMNGGKIIAEGTSEELKLLVGSERLEITVTNDDDFEHATRVIHEENLRTDKASKKLSFATKGGVHQLKQVLSQLDEANIEVENISFHSPTLDDVFLTLTGHMTNTVEGENNDKVEE
jgi:ABC-2 type transport system ATP-binding protein